MDLKALFDVLKTPTCPWHCIGPRLCFWREHMTVQYVHGLLFSTRGLETGLETGLSAFHCPFWQQVSYFMRLQCKTTWIISRSFLLKFVFDTFYVASNHSPDWSHGLMRCHPEGQGTMKSIICLCLTKMLHTNCDDHQDLSELLHFGWSCFPSQMTIQFGSEGGT